MKLENKLEVIQSIIFETLHDKSMIQFIIQDDELLIIFHDNWAIKQVCSILKPLGTMFVDSYIDYDKERGKIICMIY